MLFPTRIRWQDRGERRRRETTRSYIIRKTDTNKKTTHPRITRYRFLTNRKPTKESRDLFFFDTMTGDKPLLAVWGEGINLVSIENEFRRYTTRDRKTTTPAGCSSNVSIEEINLEKIKTYFWLKKNTKIVKNVF